MTGDAAGATAALLRASRGAGLPRCRDREAYAPLSSEESLVRLIREIYCISIYFTPILWCPLDAPLSSETAWIASSCALAQRRTALRQQLGGGASGEKLARPAAGEPLAPGVMLQALVRSL